MALQLVIFDLDNTLLHTAPAYAKAYQQAARDLGSELSQEVLDDMEGHGRAYTDQVLETLFGTMDRVHELRRIRDQYFMASLQAGEISFMPGAEAILTYARKRGVRTAIATSTPRHRGQEIINTFNLDKLTDFQVYGDDVAKSKPDPEIYQHTMILAACKAEDCLAIEDSEAGLSAAVASGAWSALVNSSSDFAQEFETTMNFIGQFEDLSQLLDQLIKKEGQV